MSSRAHPQAHARVTRVLRALVVAVGIAAVVTAGFGAPSGSAASGSTTVSLSVTSATQLDATACATGAAATSFGTVQPGVPVTTTADCTVGFGSSNDTSMLRAWQADRFGTAMWSPPTGAMDPLFGGGDGIQTWDVPGGSALDKLIWHGLAAPRDGTDDVFVMGGDGANTIVLARFTSAGNLKTTWSSGDGTDGYMTWSTNAGANNDGGIAVDDAGTIYLTSFDASAESSTWTAKVAGNGTPVAAWGAGGVANLNLCDPNGNSNAEWTYGVVPRADGGMYVSGTCSMAAGDAEWFAAAIGPTGQIDTSFGTNGLWSWDPSTNWDEICQMVQDPATGDLLLAGIAYPGGTATAAIARLSTAGAPRASFVGDGADVLGATTGIVGYRMAGGGIEHDINTISLDGAGHAIIGGRVSNWTSASRDAVLLRVDATTGTRDTTFGTNGWVLQNLSAGAEDGFNAVIGLADGSVYASGYVSVAGQRDAWIGRYTTTGALDTRFGTNGSIVHEIAAGRANESSALLFAADGDLLSGGTATVAAGDDSISLYRYDGAVVDDYSNTGAGSDRDWSSGAGTSTFGMCVRTLGGAASASAFTVDAGNDCATTDTDSWYAVPSVVGAGAKVATAATNVVTGTASVRFGLRPASTQRPGAYFAPVTFEVVAPSA